MMVLEAHGLDVAPKSKVANMLFLAAKITSQLGLKKPDGEGPPLFVVDKARDKALDWFGHVTKHLSQAPMS